MLAVSGRGQIKGQCTERPQLGSGSGLRGWPGRLPGGGREGHGGGQASVLCRCRRHPGHIESLVIQQEWQGMARSHIAGVEIGHGDWGVFGGDRGLGTVRVPEDVPVVTVMHNQN